MGTRPRRRGTLLGPRDGGDVSAIVQSGTLGLNSPRLAERTMITITRGTMSRTGRHEGNVDEGYCVQVTGWGQMGEYGVRPVLASERLFARDRYDRAAKNRIGSLGAYCNQRPAQSAIDAAVARVQTQVASGERGEMSISCVAAEVAS